ncbi:MAG: hypothetical protein ACFCUV_04390, partial [Rivularia sp. (in: cyanobacteria)]
DSWNAIAISTTFLITRSQFPQPPQKRDRTQTSPSLRGGTTKQSHQLVNSEDIAIASLHFITFAMTK